MRRALTAAEVAEITKDGNHRIDRGLYLAIRKGGKSRSWLFRYSRNGRAHWLGLGPARLFGLTEAKRKAVAAEKLLHDGIDPLGARAARREAEKARAAMPTFAACAEAFIAAHQDGWSNAKHAYQVRQSLESYAYPIIGQRPVDAIDANHLVEVLEPIWATKTETATRVRSRIESVLDWAASAGHRSGENPARWKGQLSHRLPPPRRVAKVKNHVAIPYADAPALFAAATETTTGQLLRFIMLTAVRFNEAAKATWSEFNLDAAVWTIPGERMKMREPHRVPLTDAALEILAALKSDKPKPKPNDLVFAGQTPGKTISDTAVRKALRKIGPADADTHGLRSTFRDWSAEQTDYAGEIAEAALAHVTGNAVELAYKRTTFFDKRRALMTDWAGFLAGKSTQGEAPKSVDSAEVEEA